VVRKLTTVSKFLCVIALLCLPIVSSAQRSSELSADFPDSRTMAVQEKVEKLFDRGDYERAFFIYRNELSPIGDKYAQYMVGFMYQSGIGVDEDPIAAGAWYQLAAERGTREFVVVRDRYMHVMDEKDAAESVALFKQLRLKYCDVAVVLASIKRNVRELQSRTGSRIGSQSSPVVVIETGSSNYSAGSDFYGAIRDELEARLILLKEIGDFQDFETDPNRINIHEIERRVLAHIEANVD
jgi:hypothetical protein